MFRHLVAFVIANGTSRLGFNLRQLIGLGPIYGCNALYREYAPNYDLPNYLIAIDDGMIEEIRNSDFPKNRFIVPPLSERWEPKECNPNQPRSNAGMNAMIEAIRHGATTVIGLGFDFMLNDVGQSVSNVYDETINYGPNTRARHEDNFGRARYLNWLVSNNPTVDFLLCYEYEADIALRRMPSSNSNISTITYKQLLNNISDEHPDSRIL